MEKETVPQSVAKQPSLLIMAAQPHLAVACRFMLAVLFVPIPARFIREGIEQPPHVSKHIWGLCRQ